MKLFSKLTLGILFALLIGGCGGSSDSDVNYVAIGASDATGVGADPITRGYVFQIRDQLASNLISTKLTNLGIPGVGVIQMRDVETPLANREHPDLITIFAGGNDLIGGDSPEEFGDNLASMVEDLRNHTDAFIVIATLPNATLAPKFVDKPAVTVTVDRLNAFNAAILGVAAKYGLSVADLRDAPVNSEVTASDGFHPNNEGYDLIAQRFLATILPHFQSLATSNEN